MHVILIWSLIKWKTAMSFRAFIWYLSMYSSSSRQSLQKDDWTKGSLHKWLIRQWPVMKITNVPTIYPWSNPEVIQEQHVLCVLTLAHLDLWALYVFCRTSALQYLFEILRPRIPDSEAMLAALRIAKISNWNAVVCFPSGKLDFIFMSAEKTPADVRLLEPSVYILKSTDTNWTSCPRLYGKFEKYKTPHWSFLTPRSKDRRADALICMFTNKIGNRCSGTTTFSSLLKIMKYWFNQQLPKCCQNWIDEQLLQYDTRIRFDV